MRMRRSIRITASAFLTLALSFLGLGLLIGSMVAPGPAMSCYEAAR